MKQLSSTLALICIALAVITFSITACSDETPASKNDSATESNITSAEDQYLKGVVCYYTEDYSEAVKWFRKAAEQEHVKAQFELARCYTLGEGVTENQVEAVKWFRKAADQGHVEAQGALGVLYYEGVGTTKNQVEGIKLLRKAAEGGSESARGFLRDHGY